MYISNRSYTANRIHGDSLDIGESRETLDTGKNFVTIGEIQEKMLLQVTQAGIESAIFELGSLFVAFVL